MERRKRRTGVSEEEKKALVKAAAWAWYQRGVGQEGMPERELHAPRPPRELRPSRFKLEAAATAHRVTRSQPPRRSGAAAASRRCTRGDIFGLPCSISQDGGAAGADQRGTRGVMHILPRSTEATRKKPAVPLKMNAFWMKHAVGVCGAAAADVPLVKLVAPPGPRKSPGGAAARIVKS